MTEHEAVLRAVDELAERYAESNDPGERAFGRLAVAMLDCADEYAVDTIAAQLVRYATDLPDGKEG